MSSSSSGGEKRGKINLGLSRGNSASPFMSFRFSPESEAIEEVTVTQPEICSTPTSPKASGDTSPLKEYLLKEKSRWAGKWDKKSLSLDLDLKGRFKTAFEDKTKNILSNLIPPEEEKNLSHSQSIPDNLTLQPPPATTGEEEEEDESITESSPPASSRQEQQRGSSLETLDGSEIQDEFVELGQDLIMDGLEKSVTEFDADSGRITEALTFYLGPEDLEEAFEGHPTLYQPLAVLKGQRPTPFEVTMPEGTNKVEKAEEVKEENKEPEPVDQEKLLHDSKISTLVMNILGDLVYHPWTRWWVVFFALAFILPRGSLHSFLWFFLGAFLVLLVNSAFTSQSDRSNQNQTSAANEEGGGKEKTVISGGAVSGLRMQGFMTQLIGEDYDPETCHFRMTKSVYVKLEDHRLYLSYPNYGRARIPKRRLWSDEPITRPLLFEKVKVYELSGANVKILPDGLARNRVWNKKYPIAVQLPRYSVFYEVSPELDPSAPEQQGQSSSSSKGSPPTVNYNAAAARADVKSTYWSEVRRKEIDRKDCGDEVLYLFARCDREKDDWFRVLAQASRSGPVANFFFRSPPDYTAEFREFLKRHAPLLGPVIWWNQTTNSADPDDLTIYSQRPGGGNFTRERANSLPSSSKGKGVRGFLSSKKDKEKAGSPRNSPTLPPKRGSPLAEDMAVGGFPDQGLPIFTYGPSYLNGLIGRLLFDFLKSPYWTAKIQQLIDKKLFYMKKPIYVEALRVKELKLGNALPVITKVSPPLVDQQGLWIDMDVSYEGTFTLTIEAFANFMKVYSGNGGRATATPPPPSPTTEPSSSSPKKAETDSGGQRFSHIYDPDADDSGESSDEEDESESLLASFHAEVERHPQSNTNRLIGFVANTGLVKKIVNTVAATPVVLSVELQAFSGVLALNVPHPPSDRFWLGFRTNPNLRLLVQPKFGTANLNLSRLVDWIKSKLVLEFQRAMVCPNMVDVSISLMEFGIPQ